MNEENKWDQILETDIIRELLKRVIHDKNWGSNAKDEVR